MLAIAVDAVLDVHRCEARLVLGGLPEGVSPGQSDRTLEAAVVVLEGLVGGEIRRLSSVREIVRGEDGRPSGLHALASSRKGGLDLEGPMAGLLPHVRPDAGMSMLARAMLRRMGYDFDGRV